MNTHLEPLREDTDEKRNFIESKEADVVSEVTVSPNLQQPTLLPSQESKREIANSSSSTSDIAQAKRVARAVVAARSHWHNRYCIKDIRDLIKTAYPNPSDIVSVSSSTTGKSKNIFLNELFDEVGDIVTLKTEEMDLLLETLKQLLKEKETLPSRAIFKKEFLRLCKPTSVKAARETLLEAEDQKDITNEERILRLQAREEAVVEGVLKEDELEQNEKEIARRKQTGEESAHFRQSLEQTRRSGMVLFPGLGQESVSLNARRSEMDQIGTVAKSVNKKRGFSDDQLEHGSEEGVVEPYERAVKGTKVGGSEVDGGAYNKDSRSLSPR